MSKEFRHAYVSPGIDREAFVTKAILMTGENPNLFYYVHTHSYNDHRESAGACPSTCSVIYQGIVTQVDQLPGMNVGVE
jgi:hypothetical protein